MRYFQQDCGMVDTYGLSAATYGDYKAFGRVDHSVSVSVSVA